MAEGPNKIEPVDLARLHYSVKTEKDPAAYVREQLKGSDYELQNLNRGVAHYKRISDGSHHVSIKGTDPNMFKDLVSDFKLGVGLGGTDKQFKRRTNQVKEIYRNNPEGDKYIVGHSLGGSIGTHMMTKSKGIRAATKQADFFNTGYTPAFHNELRSGLSKDDKKELKSKVTHHHILGDVVSSSLLQKAIGKIKPYKIKSGDLLKKHAVSSFK
jgi:hypothetical protein